MPVPIGPVPTEISIDVAKAEGQESMLVFVADTPTGQQVYFMQLDQARAIAAAMVELADSVDVPKLLKPNLVVPRMN